MRIWSICSVLFMLIGVAAQAQSILARPAMPPVRESPEQVNAKTSAVSSEIPVDVGDLIIEYEGSDQSLAQVRSILSYLHPTEIDQSGVQAEESQLNSVISDLEKLNCNDAKGFESTKISFVSANSRMENLLEDDSPFFQSATSNLGTSRQDNCQSFRQEILEIGKSGVSTWVNKVITENGNTEKLISAYQKYGTALEHRKESLNAAIREIQQRENLTGKFIYFIILFGALSLGAMLIVSKMFNEELQMEWVGSGQVTQFVTVMILLTVITMLGLSKTINSEALGTLLGGVAGYVLAQGVGRAAARDASRNLAAPK